MSQEKVKLTTIQFYHLMDFFETHCWDSLEKDRLMILLHIDKVLKECSERIPDEID